MELTRVLFCFRIGEEQRRMARVAFGFAGVALLHQHSSIVGDSIGSLYELVWGSMDLDHLSLFSFLCLG